VITEQTNRGPLIALGTAERSQGGDLMPLAGAESYRACEWTENDITPVLHPCPETFYKSLISLALPRGIEPLFSP
jgi:hypothetical protein